MQHDRPTDHVDQVTMLNQIRVTRIIF